MHKQSTILPTKQKNTTFAHANRKRTIKRLSYIIRFVVVLVLGLYLGLLFFTTAPVCQRWLAGKASDVLSEELNTHVGISHARIGLFNRVVLDDVLLLDQQSDTLLAAARLSVKIDVWQLIQGRVRIGSAQLFGYDIRLHRPTWKDPYNSQFIIDRFASQDSTSTPLDLAISTIIVRRGKLSHDIDSVPFSDRFTPAHLLLDDLNLKASISAATESRFDANISEFGFVDLRSGLTIKNLKAHFWGTPNQAELTNVSLHLPNSVLTIPSISVSNGFQSLLTNKMFFHLRGDVTPQDLAPFYPPLARFDRPIHIALRGNKDAADIRLQHMTLSSKGLAFDAEGQATLEEVSDSTTHIALGQWRGRITQLQLQPIFTEPVLQLLSTTGSSPILPASTAALLNRLGTVRLTGDASGNALQGDMAGHLLAHTSLGALEARGDLHGQDKFTVHAETTSFQLARLLHENSDFPVDNINLLADAQGSIRQRQLQASATLKDLLLKGTQLSHINTQFSLSPHLVKGTVNVVDDEYDLQLSTDLHSVKELQLTAEMLDHIEGHIGLDHVRVHRESTTYELRQLHFSTANDDHGHHLLISGDFIDAHADGRFRYTSIVPAVQHTLHQVLPSLITEPATVPATSDDQVTFSVHMWNATPMLQLVDIPLRLPEPGYIEGSMNMPHNEFSVMADFPHLEYGSEDLRAVSMLARQEGDSIVSFVTLQRMMDAGPMDLSVFAEGKHDKLNATFAWDDHNMPAERGELATSALFFKDDEDHLGADIRILPTDIVISDTIWNVHEARVRYDKGAVDVSGFRIAQADRHLRIDGRVSENPTDTLYANLRRINLEYVFGIIDFHDVEFEGQATGDVKVHDIFKDIAVDANLHVEDLVLNGGLLGEAFVNGGFGRKDDRAIDLDILIREPVRGQLSTVRGIVKPGHEPGRGLDLDIRANYLNIYFINFFAEDIFDDLQGRTTGYAHLYGPFKQLDLEGELALDTVSLGIPVIGTRYHTLGGDSIHLYPGGIRFTDVQLYDRYHRTDNLAHHAILNGELRYEHFKNLRYTFDIAADDFLGYDFKDFGDQTFYGTVYADGNVHLAGQPGELTVDIKCTPLQGTVFTYNVSSPTTLTDNEFITFKTASAPTVSDTDIIAEPTDPEQNDEPIDMHINFDLDITPEAQIRLLMDARSEDYINLYGDAHIRANFYNKGRFQMYGTYRVDHGTYRLSLQDVIRKEFRFQQGSTIVFGGDPMKGDLNLQAIYTVPSVSLNDLAVGNNFSSGNVRVNCIMNIGGRAEQPQVTFDFDIPNVNEDEKQMVRSLISTDEERNMQVIYLLGIGRFYTQDLGAGQNQANAAMQSLLSSTISGQLNNALSSIIGNSNWNFGTNLSTGTNGWNEVDVEGMLSGRLLNNRLLINGTFGYRDTPIANTNFIGDFDVQWLLTKSGNISLKAYSETNDRYFTKTALTTQGIGIQVKKDFNTLGELFRFRRKSSLTK